MKKTVSILLAVLVLFACAPSFASRPFLPPAEPRPPIDPSMPGLAPRPTEGADHPGQPIGFAQLFNPDADFDGIPDYADSDAKDNAFASTVFHTKPSEDIDATYSYTYEWDYSWFLGDASAFNSGLCRLSSLLSALGYHRTDDDIPTSSDDLYTVSNNLGVHMKLPELMQAHGMTVTEFNLINYYDDNHLTLADVGIHTVITDDGGTHDVVLIGMRGSNGTWAEWNSNFEIGHTIAGCDTDFVPQRFGTHPDWTDPDNHMGFDIAANRVLALVRGFVAEHGTGADDVTYWVTGHSRGGAVANLLAAKLTDEGEKVFAYCFACPNATLASAAGDYDTIFNVANEDDMVAYLPFNEWGYHRYGRSARLDMDDGMRAQWKEMMDESYDHAESTLTNALDKLSAIASCRNDCYAYTCSCHGDGTDDDIKTSNWYITKANREKAIAKTPACLAGYYKLELEDATFYWTHHCQPPIFFMQYLACYLSGGMETTAFADYDVADKYESAKWALVPAAAMGVEHPHYCESYFILADTVSAADFIG